MSSRLGSALGRVDRDLRATGGIALRVSEGSVTSDPAYESVWLDGDDGSRMGLMVPLEMSTADVLVHVADQVQEFVVEELWTLGRPATWPECPEHPASHPLRPVLPSSWGCPKSGHTIAAIGEL